MYSQPMDGVTKEYDFHFTIITLWLYIDWSAVLILIRHDRICDTGMALDRKFHLL